MAMRCKPTEALDFAVSGRHRLSLSNPSMTPAVAVQCLSSNHMAGGVKFVLVRLPCRI